MEDSWGGQAEIHLERHVKGRVELNNLDSVGSLIKIVSRIQFSFGVQKLQIEKFWFADQWIWQFNSVQIWCAGNSLKIPNP